MGKEKEFAEIKKAVADAEVKRAEIVEEVQKIEKELYHLNTMEEMLVGNIDYLKRNKVIAMAKEFKKATEDLKIARTRINLLVGDLKIAKKSWDNVEKILQQLGKKQVELFRSYTNNVLELFGKKNGQR